MTVEDQINRLFRWLDGAKPGHEFSMSSLVEEQTGQENQAFTQLVQRLPHIREMSARGWIKVDDRVATLTEAGVAEMQRRNPRD